MLDAEADDAADEVGAAMPVAAQAPDMIQE
jgi:hypothetical protein